MIRNFILKVLLLIVIVSTTSCINETSLESDYKVIEVNYGYDNYIKNIRDKTEPFIIKQRNLVTINVDSDGQVTIKDTAIEDSLIVAELKKYIVPNPENNQMPSTMQERFEFSGKVIMTTGLYLVAKFNKDLTYEKYSSIRNKIYAAYNEARDDFSIKKFNKTYKELAHSPEEIDHFKQQEVSTIFPIHYSEDMSE